MPRPPDLLVHESNEYTTRALSIETVDSAEIDQILQIEREVFEADAWSKKMVLEELASPWSDYCGIFDGSTLVAYGGVKGDIEGDLMTIAVIASHRQRGLGRSLLRTLLERASSRGMKQIFLEVRASNAVARQLYEEEGFRTLARVPNYYRNPTEDALTMRLELDTGNGVCQSLRTSPSAGEIGSVDIP